MKKEREELNGYFSKVEKDAQDNIKLFENMFEGKFDSLVYNTNVYYCLDD